METGARLEWALRWVENCRNRLSHRAQLDLFHSFFISAAADQHGFGVEKKAGVCCRVCGSLGGRLECS